ncbi:SDR family NAD(P)-dependent oxidoreductase [Nonomuraea longicatena]|uniref:Uncharacterized protein n=1 Tax=Nonomuraea longicatena TaxID=83682 RepID=A0ABN1P573_9ACTN
MREVVVTGGGTGIGYTIAAGFVALGDRVTVTGRRANVLAEAAARLGAAHVSFNAADTVLFLASEGARHLTGQVLHVNGGAYLGR